MVGYRTLMFGMLIAALGFAQQFVWGDLIPAGWEGFIVAGIGALMMYLRKITNTPVGTA